MNSCYCDTKEYRDVIYTYHPKLEYFAHSIKVIFLDATAEKEKHKVYSPPRAHELIHKVHDIFALLPKDTPPTPEIPSVPLSVYKNIHQIMSMDIAFSQFNGFRDLSSFDHLHNELMISSEQDPSKVANWDNLLYQQLTGNPSSDFPTLSIPQGYSNDSYRALASFLQTPHFGKIDYEKLGITKETVLDLIKLTDQCKVYLMHFHCCLWIEENKTPDVIIHLLQCFLDNQIKGDVITTCLNFLGCIYWGAKYYDHKTLLSLVLDDQGTLNKNLIIFLINSNVEYNFSIAKNGTIILNVDNISEVAVNALALLNINKVLLRFSKIKNPVVVAKLLASIQFLKASSVDLEFSKDCMIEDHLSKVITQALVNNPQKIRSIAFK